jgi:hypothetical protein
LGRVDIASSNKCIGGDRKGNALGVLSTNPKVDMLLVQIICGDLLHSAALPGELNSVKSCKQLHPSPVTIILRRDIKTLRDSA